MIKHICICDKCGKEEDMRMEYGNGSPIYKNPDMWKEYGIHPKYLLCPSCSAELTAKLESVIYNFVKGK